MYRGTTFTRKGPPPGPYSSPVHRALWWSEGGVRFLMGEVPLYVQPNSSISYMFGTHNSVSIICGAHDNRKVDDGMHVGGMVDVTSAVHPCSPLLQGLMAPPSLARLSSTQ